MFNVDIYNEKDNIIGELVVDSYFFDNSKYEYAFYLHQNGEKTEVKWYTKNMKVAFDIKGLSGVFQLKCFIRDIESKDVRSFKSDTISIDT